MSEKSQQRLYSFKEKFQHGLEIANSLLRNRREGHFDDSSSVNVYGKPDVKYGKSTDTAAEATLKILRQEGETDEAFLSYVQKKLPREYHNPALEYEGYRKWKRSQIPEDMWQAPPEELIRAKKKIDEFGKENDEALVRELKDIMKLSMIAIRRRIKLVDQTLDEDELQSLNDIVKFFMGQGYSVLDILIRCSFGIIKAYTQLWEILDKQGFLKNLT